MASKRKADDASGDDAGAEAAGAGAGAGADSGAEETKKRGAKKPKKEAKEKKEKKEKKTKAAPVGPQFNVNKALDKKHEGKSLRDIIQLPPSALEGLGDKHDEMFAEFNINTIADMANWKFFKMARAMVALAAVEEKGKRPASSKMNINNAVDAKYEEKSLKDVIKAPVSALQGLAKWADKTLQGKSIKDLGTWKFFVWADALVTLAGYEVDLA